MSVVIYDFDFRFRNGHELQFSAEQGRDVIAADDHRVKVQLRQSPECSEEIIVYLEDTSYHRIIQRTVEDESTTEDAGTIKVTGAPDA
tara:strand:+ start:297 stop:560 length:264 start_codon:yes stop_codon:yes gene_type:complete